MTEAALRTAAAWKRPSAPRPGSSLVAATEERAVHVRRAVESVRRSFDGRASTARTWTTVLASRWRLEPIASPAALAGQAAWALVSMRIVGRSVGALPARASLRDGEAWFLGNTPPSDSFSDTLGDLVDREAVQALESFAYDDDLRDLLPYVLDAHGPGSRASVMKDPGTRMSRRAKREGGIFYTPSDVAEYIARETLGEPGRWPSPAPRVLDPACGSGVFLKAVLDLTARRTPGLDRLAFVERSLHGIDVNPLAVEAACFVLLHECLAAGWRGRDESPWSRWHRIRCNLCVADALTFQVADLNHDGADALAGVRSRLGDGYLPPAAGRAAPEGAATLFSEGRPLGSVFPALAAGADIVIGNPPYAKIGPRADAAALERRFASISTRTVAGSDYFPVFVEMMWRLARPTRSAAGMVVPLSLACSRRSQASALRRAITASGGRWRFAFFDREPHALFGEEVKTLDKIKPVFEECFRVLQPGRKCCLVTANVNQHTDHGLLTFPLAADFGTLLRNIGFMMVSEIIWSKDGTGGRWGSANAQRPIFGSYPYPPNFLFKNVHEHILVFSKPPARKSRGPKVVPYDELMADARRT